MSQKNPYNDRVVTKVFNQDFVIDKRFKIVKELGHGAYGIVCSAKYEDGSSEDGCYVAIKKITNIFSKKILCKRSLRELKLLQFFRGHKNITCLYDLDIIADPVSGEFNEIYLYEELMECDMHQIIRSGQPLTDSHYQFFIYQTLCGLKYIHSADVLHRDLKPGNLLVNADCELKICDFGLARGFLEIPEHNVGFMTEYVATRWYRAPEIMLSFTNYTKLALKQKSSPVFKKRYNVIIHPVVDDTLVPSIEIPLLSLDLSRWVKDCKLDDLYLDDTSLWCFAKSGDLFKYIFI